MTEKQRVSLTPGAWFAVVGVLLGGAGAWWTTRAEASQALAASTQNTADIKTHDREIQTQAGESKVVREILQRLEKTTERIERKVDRGGHR